MPYYLRIRDHFASLIERGSLVSGEKLPSERKLKDRFRITRVTVRRALMQLETEGLIYREKRRGWFVSPPRLRYDPTMNVSFTESVMAQGRVPGTIVLSKERISATSWESEHLNVPIGAPVYLIRRIRLVDARPVLIEHIHVDAARCPGLLDLPLDRSLTGLLSENFGIVEQRARIVMRPAALKEPQAEPLGVTAGTPSLHLFRIIYDQFGDVVEFDQEFWRHDALEIAVDVNVEGREVASRRSKGSA